MTSRSPSTVLVVGATGHLGQRVVQMIRESGRAVRAVVRSQSDPARVAAVRSLGADTVEADLKDNGSVQRACEGAGAIVATATAIVRRGPDDSLESVDDLGMLSLVRHAREAGVGHFVYLSFPRSDLNYIFQGVKRKVEAELQRRDRASMSYTIIRSAPFMEVWLSPFLGFDPLAGRVEVLGDGTRPISWISIQDVARFAAAASEGGPFANRVLEVGGPEALSYLDVLKAFTAVVGRPVVPVFTDVGELESAFARSTEPKGQALAAARLITARGTTVDGRAAQALLPGRLVAISDYARSFGGAARSGQGGSQ